MSKSKLAKHTGSMSIAVFLSRLLGLLRDVLMTNFFGTSYVADAFQVAYQIPNLLRKLFGEGALSAAFVPVYNEIGIKKGKKAQIDFALNVLSILCALLMILCGAGMLLAPIIVKILAPGFTPETTLLAAKLTRIMFPYLLLIGFSSTLISILNSHDYFFIPGLSSAFLNIGIITLMGIYLLIYEQSADEQKIVVWSVGVIFGGILQTIVNFPILKKIGFRLKIILNINNEALRTVWTKFIPGVWGLAIRQVNLAADMILASLLVTGSIAALNYGNRLMQLPLGIIGVSAGVAVLPLFSRYIAEEKWDELIDGLRFSLVSIAFIMIPVTAIMAIFGKDLIALIFMRGKFDSVSLDMTYKAFLFYSLGLTFFSMNRILIPIFYAHKNTKTPVKISAVIVLINIILNIVLMQFLQHAGLALATTISALIQLLLLHKYMNKLYPRIKIKGVLLSIGKILIITAFLAVGLKTLNDLIQVDNKLLLLLKIIILNICFLLLFLGGSIIMNIEYSRKIVKILWKRIRK